MSNATTRRWWLVVNGQADGPRTLAYITAAMQSGQIGPATQACPEGGTEWKPLNTWPELAGLMGTNAAAPGYGTTQFPSAGVNQGALPPSSLGTLLSNPQLPAMANAICIFTIGLLPLYWVFGLATNFATLANPNPGDAGVAGFFFGLCLDAPVALAITVALALGGLRLRDRRASGIRWLKVGLWCDFAWIGVRLLLVVPLLIFVAANETTPGATHGLEIFLNVVQIMAGIAALVFEIAALIWLTRNQNALQLNPAA